MAAENSKIKAAIYARVSTFNGGQDPPQLNRMMQGAHEGRFDVVVVWRF
jgi:hypothetical protein